MNELDMLNQPVEFDVAGKKLHFKRISTAQKLALAYSDYLANLVREVKIKADAFAEADERRTYIREELAKLPSGSALQKVVDEDNIGTDLIVRWLVAANADGLDYDGIELLFDEATKEEVTAVVAFLRYGKKNLTSRLITGDSSVKTLPNDTGTPRIKSES